MSHSQKRQRPGSSIQDRRIVQQVLAATMPHRTPSENCAIVDNNDQHLSVAMPSPNDTEADHVRNSKQLDAIAEPTLLVDCAHEVDRKILLPTLKGRISSSCENFKTWHALEISLAVQFAIQDLGHKYPSFMERSVITATREGVSAIISSGPGRDKIVVAPIASVDLILKARPRNPGFGHTYEVCAPIVIMVVPTHDLAESLHAEVTTFIADPNSGLQYYVRPLCIHDDIPRIDRFSLIQRNNNANIVIATPAILADMACYNLISSHSTKLFVVHQAFTLANGSYQKDMKFIKIWLQDQPAVHSQGVQKHDATPSTTGPGSHVYTSSTEGPAADDMLGDTVLSAPRRIIPAIILDQELAPGSQRDPRFLKHYKNRFSTTKSSITLRFMPHLQCPTKTQNNINTGPPSTDEQPKHLDTSADIDPSSSLERLKELDSSAVAFPEVPNHGTHTPSQEPQKHVTVAFNDFPTSSSMVELPKVSSNPTVKHSDHGSFVDAFTPDAIQHCPYGITHYKKSCPLGTMCSLNKVCHFNSTPRGCVKSNCGFSHEIKVSCPYIMKKGNCNPSLKKPCIFNHDRKVCRLFEELSLLHISGNYGLVEDDDESEADVETETETETEVASEAEVKVSNEAEPVSVTEMKLV